MMRRTGHGFTLIEMLVTLALLGLVFGVATMKFHVLFSRSRLQAGAHGVGDHFAYAINRAYTTGRHQTLVFDLGHQAYWVRPGREDEAGGAVLLKRRLARGTSFADIQVGYDRYQPPGLLSIEVSPLGITNDIIVNLTDEKQNVQAVCLYALAQRVAYRDGHCDYGEVQDAPGY